MEDNHPKIDEKFMKEAMQSFDKAWRSGELRELMLKYPRGSNSTPKRLKEYVLLDHCMALPLRLDDVEAELKSGDIARTKSPAVQSNSPSRAILNMGILRQSTAGPRLTTNCMGAICRSSFNCFVIMDSGRMQSTAIQTTGKT